MFPILRIYNFHIRYWL